MIVQIFIFLFVVRAKKEIWKKAKRRRFIERRWYRNGTHVIRPHLHTDTSTCYRPYHPWTRLYSRKIVAYLTIFFFLVFIRNERRAQKKKVPRKVWQSTNGGRRLCSWHPYNERWTSRSEGLGPLYLFAVAKSFNSVIVILFTRASTTYPSYNLSPWPTIYMHQCPYDVGNLVTAKMLSGPRPTSLWEDGSRD